MMAYNTYNLVWPVHHLKDGNAIQVLLTIYIETELVGVTYDWYAPSHGLLVVDYGETEWDYNVEDTLMVQGNQRMTIADNDGELSDLLFGGSLGNREYLPVLEIRRWSNYPNGQTTEFKGMLVEDDMEDDYTTKTINFTASPLTEKMFQSWMYKADGTRWDPWLREDLNDVTWLLYSNIINVISMIFNRVNSDFEYSRWTNVPNYSGGKLEIAHNWDFRGLPVGGGDAIEDIQFTELLVKPYNVFFLGSDEPQSAGEALKSLAYGFGCYAGMMHLDRAFFKKWFYYDATNTQALSEVLEHHKKHSLGLIDAIRVKYCYEGNCAEEFIPDQESYNALESRHYDIDQLAIGVMDGALDTRAYLNRPGGEEGYYYIYEVSDSDVLEGDFANIGRILAWHWYNYRGDINNCMLEVFKVRGVGLDYLKCFQYGGYKYQIKKMTKRWADCQTDIEAVNLGAV